MILIRCDKTDDFILLKNSLSTNLFKVTIKKFDKEYKSIFLEKKRL